MQRRISQEEQIIRGGDIGVEVGPQAQLHQHDLLRDPDEVDDQQLLLINLPGRLPSLPSWDQLHGRLSQARDSSFVCDEALGID